MSRHSILFALFSFALLSHFFRANVASHCWHSHIWHSHSCLICTVDPFALLAFALLASHWCRSHFCLSHSCRTSGRLSGSFRLRAHRSVQSRPVLSQSVHHRIFPDVNFYTQSTAAAQTAPDGIKERASFILVCRSLNTTSTHRKFSIGYRRANSTEGNTNFQKEYFWQ